MLRRKGDEWKSDIPEEKEAGKQNAFPLISESEAKRKDRCIIL
jgi:hypothetical protein